MAHELALKADGSYAMAYTGHAPWHMEGKHLERGASMLTWREAAGFDFRVQASPAFYATKMIIDADGNYIPSGMMKDDSRRVLYRSDNKNVLGHVSAKYEIVQPKDILYFFEGAAQAAGYELETAGVLFDGRVFWAMASTGDEAEVGAGDVYKRYLVLSTSCDGSMHTEGRYTDIRVVCNNTLTASRYAPATFSLSHRMKFDASNARKVLGVEKTHSSFADTMADMRMLADTRMTEEQVVTQTAGLFGDALRMGQMEFARLLDRKPVQNIIRNALDGSMIGGEFDGMKGTQWGWLNSVTQEVDHEGERARTDAARLESAWFGKGSAMKEKALSMALEQAEDGTVHQVLIENTIAHGASDFAALLAK